VTPSSGTTAIHHMLTALYFAGMVVQVIVRVPYNRRRRQMPKIDRRITLAEYSLLGGLFAAMLLVPVAYAATPWLDFASYKLTPPMRKLLGGAGAVFLAASLWLFWRAHRDLGTNWSPSLEIGTEHTLVTTGVYGAIRHPMYASHLLWSIAQTLLLHNWIAGWASLVGFPTFYLWRIPAEERMMLDHFGEAYRTHCRRTGRLVPRLRGLITAKKN